MVLEQLNMYGQKLNLDLSLTLYIKINSKQIMDVHVKHKIIKLLRKKMFKNWDLGVGKELRT